MMVMTLKCSNWGVNATATYHLLCEAHLFIAIITSFFDIFRVLFFIQMIVKYLKQYNYIYNVCRLNEIHLEFEKVIFRKHRQKSASLFTLIIVKRICESHLMDHFHEYEWF